MKERGAYSHGFRLDKPIRIATDNVTGYVPRSEYKPVTPPVTNNFLLLDNTDFLLLDGTDLLLL